MIANTAALFLTGFLSLVGQIVLLRELDVAFFGIELIYLIALGLWLLLSALGTLLGREKGPPLPGRMAIYFLLFAIFLPLGVVLIRASRDLFGGIPGAYLPFARQATALAITLLPAGCLSGLLFRSAAGRYTAKRGTLAGAYAIESLGGLAGGLLTTLALRFGIQDFPLALACGLTSAATALLLFRGKEQGRRRLAAVGVSALLALILWQAAPVDRAMTFWNHPELLSSRDSPYGRITVTKRLGQVSVFENDALLFETEGTDAELFAHVAALQHPGPRKILVLGGGIGGLVGELLKHRPAGIDAVELDRVMISLVRRHLPAGLQASLADPRVHLILADPRRSVKKRGPAYDLILIGMPEPASGRANRFYTEEFFRECSSRLAPGGILALRLPAAENFWTPLLINRTASIRRALAAVFPEVLLLPGATTVITASKSPLPRSPEILTDRLRDRGITARLVSPPFIRYLFTNDRRADIERRLAGVVVPANTDLHPVCYPYAVMLWLANFFPKLALADLPGLGGKEGLGNAPWLMGLGLILLFLTSRLLPSLRRVLLVTAAGFLGAVFEAVLILNYQATEGALYQDIGLLLMAFMAGLAAGAWIVRGLIGKKGQRGTHWWGVCLLIGFALVGAAVNWSLDGATTGGLVTTGVLLGATGFLVAAIIAYAGLFGVSSQGQVVGPLYAADLLGGCLGSLLGSLLLIPVLGLDGSVLAMMLLAALALLLV